MKKNLLTATSATRKGALRSAEASCPWGPVSGLIEQRSTDRRPGGSDQQGSGLVQNTESALAR